MDKTGEKEVLRAARLADPLTHLKECGTRACLLGWAPTAGILPYPKHYSSRIDKNFDWDDYAKELFGVPTKCPPPQGAVDEWNFLFGAHWPDDQLAGAERIAWLLEGRTTSHEPEDFPLVRYNWKPNWPFVESLLA